MRTRRDPRRARPLNIGLERTPELKFGHVPPHPLQTMIQKRKIIILCSIRTHSCNWLLHKNVFILQKLTLSSLFRGGRGDAGLVTCTCASSGVQEVVAWTAFTYACHSEGSTFGSQKDKKNRDANTGLPSSRFLPRMLFVLK